MEKLRQLIEELTQHALRLKEQRQVLSKALLEIRELALDSVDGDPKHRGMDTRWSRVMTMVDTALEQVSK